MRRPTRRDFLQKLTAAYLSLSVYGLGRSEKLSSKEVEALFELLHAEVGAAVANKEAVGISFGIQKQGEPPLLGALGRASLDSPKLMKADTPLRIASVTKTFIAAAIMMLVESGELRLDHAINSFFPNFPEGQELTVYHLLTHTSGLKDWWEAGLPEDAPGDFPQQPHPHHILEQVNDPFHFQPGQHHWYSNTGYVLLGDIVETVSGQRLSEFLKTRIFEPANLNHTFYDPSPEQSAAWARGHHLSPESPEGFVTTSFTGSPGAAGGIWSSASDLLRWSNALFSGAILSKASVAKMSDFARLTDGRPTHESTWYPDWMESPPPKIDFMHQSGWGIGFSVFTSRGQKVVWHSGGIPGFNAIWLNVPQKSLSIALLANTDNGVVSTFKRIVPEAVKGRAWEPTRT